MGVINLGLLVDKIKRKLEGAGFIKSTDYASASAAGVVKVGEGLNITDAGVLSASGGSAGLTVDTIWIGQVTSDYKNITEALTHPITDYKFLLINYKSGVNVTPGQLLYVANMADAALSSNYLYFGGNNVNIRLNEGTVSIGGGAYNEVSLLGIK